MQMEAFDRKADACTSLVLLARVGHWHALAAAPDGTRPTLVQRPALVWVCLSLGNIWRMSLK